MTKPTPQLVLVFTALLWAVLETQSNVDAFSPAPVTVTSADGLRRILPKAKLQQVSTSEHQRTSIPQENGGKRPADLMDVIMHLASCFIAAVLVCQYEDYDCRNLKPAVTSLRPHAVRGLGEGRSDRVADWRAGNILVTSEDISLVEVPSYNEIMLQHRQSRVPGWSQDKISERDVRNAVRCIQDALDATIRLKDVADTYEWENMRELIRRPVLSTELEDACSLLRSAKSFLTSEARQEIGFDWGSCAWRHCGAEADAQESLSELYNLSGVLEPFECKFIIDIVERSLRDILTVTPSKYIDRPVPKYEAYQPVSQVSVDEEEDSTIDLGFMKALEDLRSSLDED